MKVVSCGYREEKHKLICYCFMLKNGDSFTGDYHGSVVDILNEMKDYPQEWIVGDGFAVKASNIECFYEYVED